MRGWGIPNQSCGNIDMNMPLSGMQVLADAQVVDEAAAAGKDTGPLCGLAFAVKDNIDVLG